MPPFPSKFRAALRVGAVALAAAALLGFGFWLARTTPLRAGAIAAARLPEQLVYSRANDDIVNCGALYSPSSPTPGAIAVIWVHGWGVNFYAPSYVAIGRALAERGYTALTVNTRMHDVGFNIGQHGGKRIRGGGYWGVPSDQVRDIGAWIDLLEQRGFKKIALVGHSAGWAAVRLYQARTQDQRVAGVVLASGAVRPDTQKADPEMLAQATRLLAEGHDDDLIRIPNRQPPSFISAATYFDIETNYPAGQRDFFGVQTANPDVTRIRCPLLAFFGTGESDIGTAADLELLEASIQKQPTGPRRVNTTMIQGADHMYSGHEADVAKTIADWLDKL